MPTQAVAHEVMGVGKKNGGKNWTLAEKQARTAAAADFERKDEAKLKPPAWLSKAAVEVWDKKIAEIAGLRAGSELLDALDSEILGAYCDAVVNYSKLTQRTRKTMDTYKLIQSYHRILNQTADRLGFTPGARARLVKKRADGPEADTFGAKFD